MKAILSLIKRARIKIVKGCCGVYIVISRNGKVIINIG